MMASLFPHIGTDFTPFQSLHLAAHRAFQHHFDLSVQQRKVQPFHVDKPWVWLLYSARVAQAQLWLSDPWCKEIRSCSKGSAICFENYKTVILVRKFWCCRGDWSLSEDVEPSDTGERVSHVDYHFFFLGKGCEMSLDQDPSATSWHWLVLSPLKSDMLPEKPSTVVCFCELTWWFGIISIKLFQSFCSCFKKTLFGLMWDFLKVFPKLCDFAELVSHGKVGCSVVCVCLSVCVYSIMLLKTVKHSTHHLP